MFLPDTADAIYARKCMKLIDVVDIREDFTDRKIGWFINGVVQWLVELGSSDGYGV